MGKMSRDKGKRGEYEVRDWLKKITNIEWMRTPLSGGFHLSFPSDVMKKRGTDVSIFDGLCLEVKNTATLHLPDWIKQCEEAEQDFNGIILGKSVIFYKWNGKWRADMPIQQLERFLKP